MLAPFAYSRPRSTDEALAQLATEGARVLAGGTDLLGCLRDRVFGASKLVSLSDLSELKGIRTSATETWIGALTTIAEIAEHADIRDRFPGLARAAAEVASPQLRNQGTLGGNLCQRPRCWYFRGEFHCARKGGDLCFAVDGENRYHAIFGGDPCYIVHPSDTAPMLMALGASVRILAPGAAREIPLEDFFVLPGEDLYHENRLRADDIVAGVIVPATAPGAHNSYRKARERGAWDFALASVALALSLEGRRVAAARVVFGGVAPMPWRARGVETALVGRELDSTTIEAAADSAIEGAEPLAQNGYKVPLLRGLLVESLTGI